jgi:hypothetical protein
VSMNRSSHGRAHKRAWATSESGRTRLGLVLVLVVLLGVAVFFALGGSVDSDIQGGKVNVEKLKGDVDVNTPKVEVRKPDVKVDPGDVKVEPVPKAHADANSGDN